MTITSLMKVSMLFLCGPGCFGLMNRFRAHTKGSGLVGKVTSSTVPKPPWPSCLRLRTRSSPSLNEKWTGKVNCCPCSPMNRLQWLLKILFWNLRKSLLWLRPINLGMSLAGIGSHARVTPVTVILSVNEIGRLHGSVTACPLPSSWWCSACESDRTRSSICNICAVLIVESRRRVDRGRRVYGHIIMSMHHQAESMLSAYCSAHWQDTVLRKHE